MARKQKMSIGPEFVLLAELARDISVQELKHIAGYDYSQDVEKHFEKLLEIKQKLDLSGLDVWYPLEVLELCRWNALSTNEVRGHLCRAFSCTVILQQSLHDNIALDSTLGVLLESLQCYDDRLFESALPFLRAQFERMNGEDEERLLLRCGLAICMFVAKDFNALTHELDAIFRQRARLNPAIEFIVETRPQFDDGWRYMAFHLYENLMSVSDADLRNKLTKFIKMLWLPEPNEYVIQFPEI